MRRELLALSTAGFVFWGEAAADEFRLTETALDVRQPETAGDFRRAEEAKPRKIVTIGVAAREVDVMAVTERARLHAGPAYVDHRTLKGGVKPWQKQMPGHPQPAVVSFGLRMRF